METLTPDFETARLEALRRYDVLDTSPEEDFDRITRLAARVFTVPFAYISFLEEHRQWNKSAFGLTLTEVPRGASFCTYTVYSGEILVVEDAVRDPRFAGSPLVTAHPYIRFYAGAPVRSPDGYNIGALCIADRMPRHLDAAGRDTLIDLACLTADVLEARRGGVGYRVLFENAPDPIVLHAGGEILDANKAACRLLQVDSIQPYVGTTILQFIHPGDHNLIRERIQHSQGSEIPVPATEIRLLHPERGFIDVEIHSAPTTYEGRRVSQVTFRDITESKRARRALVESEERWRGLVEANPEAILVHSGGRIVYVNPAALRLFKAVSVDQVLALSLTDFVASDYHEILRVRLERLHHEHQVLDPIEYAIIAVDGQQRTVEATSIPTVFGGQPAVQVVLRDITERKQYEEQLVQARHEAEEMSRLKSTFLANMSHEIRTPLTSIIGFAHVLSEMATDEGREFAGYIVRSSQRLMETLNSVLDLSQLESRSLRLLPQTIDLRDRINEAVELFRNRAMNDRLDMRADLPEGPVTAELDPVALDRVLSNLISNAIKFTREGSITVHARCDGDTAEIRVVDTGIGIDPAFLPHVFDEFRQESSGHERGYEGSGLGLTITRQLVEMMGGTIEVDSVKGSGSTFTVRLPRGRAASGMGQK